MKLVLIPSLEQMALVKIGIYLWNQDDIAALVSKLSYVNLCANKWNKIKEKVTQKVQQLPLPELLQEEVFRVIKPIGMEIFYWMKYYCRYDAHDPDSDLPAHSPADICWTPHYTVDRKRTAEVLIKDENLSVNRRYRLACDSFLEKDINRFWNALPENLKVYDWDKFPVANFWTKIMKREIVCYDSYETLFKSSARNSHKVAAKYFLLQLLPNDRKFCLRWLILDLKNADVLWFFLSEMEEECQLHTLRYDPNSLLECFLEWPWQSFFIGVANCLWKLLSKDNFNKILRDILEAKSSYNDYNYNQLFREVWQKIPRGPLKDSLIEEIVVKNLFPIKDKENTKFIKNLFPIKDKENTRFILKGATSKVKEKLIYSSQSIDNISCSIIANEWDFPEFFIRECLPSKNEMLKFKEHFEQCPKRLKLLVKGILAIKKHQTKWNQIFCPSDDTICESDKRSLEAGEDTLSKRFKSLQ